MKLLHPLHKSDNFIIFRFMNSIYRDYLQTGHPAPLYPLWMDSNLEYNLGGNFLLPLYLQHKNGRKVVILRE